MKDLHSHILFGIDDGSDDIEESIKLLRKMKDSGIREVILTPHYIENTKYSCNNKDKKEIFRELKNRVLKEEIDIKLYLGNEVFFTDDFIGLLEKGEVSTLNNSKYFLFEFPMRQIYNNSSEIISKLVSNGYVPILAHPERYRKFQEHPELVEDFLRMGVYLQGNFTSLFGKYGRKCEKTLKYFLKKKYISFLGSDTHHDVNFNCAKLEKKLLRITKDKDYVADIMANNFDKIINNQDFSIKR